MTTKKMGLMLKNEVKLNFTIDVFLKNLSLRNIRWFVRMRQSEKVQLCCSVVLLDDPKLFFVTRLVNLNTNKRSSLTCSSGLSNRCFYSKSCLKTFLLVCCWSLPKWMAWGTSLKVMGELDKIKSNSCVVLKLKRNYLFLIFFSM